MPSIKMKTEDEISQPINTSKESSAVRPDLEFPIAESHFDQDTEGWTATFDGALSYSATGGHPGGCLKAIDRRLGVTFYFKAPEKFLGLELAVVATRLDYDIKAVASGNDYALADVILVGGGTVLHYNTTPPPRNVWVHCSVPLAPGTGWTNETDPNAGHPRATARDFRIVLGSLEEMKIRGEFGALGDTTFLDNVVMYAIKPRPDLPPLDRG